MTSIPRCWVWRWSSRAANIGRCRSRMSRGWRRRCRISASRRVPSTSMARTTIDYGDALEPFEKAAYRGTISIGFDGDGNPVTGVIKTRDLLVKEWVASARTK